MYLAILAILASAMWAASFAALWRDARAASDSFTTLRTFAAIHFLMARWPTDLSNARRRSALGCC
jgi:hypothetical protein